MTRRSVEELSRRENEREKHERRLWGVMARTNVTNHRFVSFRSYVQYVGEVQASRKKRAAEAGMHPRSFKVYRNPARNLNGIKIGGKMWREI